MFFCLIWVDGIIGRWDDGRSRDRPRSLPSAPEDNMYEKKQLHEGGVMYTKDMLAVLVVLVYMPLEGECVYVCIFLRGVDMCTHIPTLTYTHTHTHTYTFLTYTYAYTHRRIDRETYTEEAKDKRRKMEDGSVRVNRKKQATCIDFDPFDLCSFAPLFQIRT